MALIGEIRKRSWLLLVVIAVAMLAFVLGDVFRNQGGATNDTPITNVFGKGITQQQYDALLQQEVEKNRRVSESIYRQPYSSESQARLEEGFMQQLLSDKLYESQFNKIGLVVSPEEFNDVLQGEHVDGTIYEQFGLFVDRNTQKFSRDSLVTLMPLMIGQNPEMEYFLGTYIGEFVEKQRLRDKYNNLIKQGLYTTTYEAKKQNAANLASVNFDYVYKPFSSIPDSLINVDDNAIRTYYSKHKNEEKYKQQDVINFQYVEFAIEPSESDKEVTKDYITTKIKYFKEAENDSAYVYRNSDSKDLNFAFKPSAKFPAGFDSVLLTVDTGDVIGPYFEDGFYKISKVLDSEFEQEATVRHILLGFEKYGAGAQAKADSIERVVKTQGNFAAMVKKFSTDPGSVEKGGRYEWFDEYTMVPEFTEVSFNEPIGTIKSVRTQYGIHVIEVLGRRQSNKRKFKLATVDAVVKPSKITIEKAIEKAILFRNNFTAENITDTAFANTAKRNFVIAKSSQANINQKEITGLGSAGQVLNWGFASTTKVGDLSNELVFEDKVIIAHLQKRTEEGIPAFEDVKSQMAFEVAKEQKAALYAGKMTGASLQDVATSVGETVKTASGITLSQSSIPGSGNEPTVIGKAHSTPVNTLSGVITGNQGLFVIMPTANTPAPADADFSSQQVTSTTQLRNRAQNEVFQALYKLADVKDNRDAIRYKR